MIWNYMKYEIILHPYDTKMAHLSKVIERIYL